MINLHKKFRPLSLGSSTLENEKQTNESLNHGKTLSSNVSPSSYRKQMCSLSSWPSSLCWSSLKSWNIHWLDIAPNWNILVLINSLINQIIWITNSLHWVVQSNLNIRRQKILNGENGNNGALRWFWWLTLTHIQQIKISGNTHPIQSLEELRFQNNSKLKTLSFSSSLWWINKISFPPQMPNLPLLFSSLIIFLICVRIHSYI